MEIDLSNEEKSEHVVIWGSDDQNLLGHIRSYRCSFCKRGFSNAQALGGHMNIHRKDRAKFKEFSSLENNILSLDITKNDAPNTQPPSGDGKSLQLEVSRDEISCTPKRAASSPDQEIEPDTEDDQLQLTLSIETSSSNKYKEENSRAGRHVKGSMQLSHIESLPELDLELRLGPEPHATSKKGTIS